MGLFNRGNTQATPSYNSGHSDSQKRALQLSLQIDELNDEICRLKEAGIYCVDKVMSRKQLESELNNIIKSQKHQ